MSQIYIRQARQSDLTRVSYITKLAYKVPYKVGTLITQSHEPNNIKDLFSKKEFFVIVAISDSKIIGAVRYKFDQAGNVYLYRLAVLKMHRNKGVGRLLMNKVEKIATRSHCSKILLDCAEEKKIASYYEKLGFVVDRVDKHKGYHGVYMSKRLH